MDNVIQFVTLTLTRTPRNTSMTEPYSQPLTVAREVGPMIADSPAIRFWALALDAQNRVNAICEIALGGLDMCKVPPRTVAQFALLSNAASIICVTNMPSGVPSLSHETRQTHQDLANALAPFDILVLDTVVIGGDQYMSISQPYAKAYR